MKLPCKECISYAVCKLKKDVKCDILYDLVITAQVDNKSAIFSTYTNAKQVLTSMRSLGRETLDPIIETWP